MKKRLLILIFFLFTNLLFASEIELTTAEKNYLQTHPVLTVPEINFPPFNFKKDGVVQGFTVSYLNLIAEKLGVKIEYISGYTWAEYMVMLKTSSVDMLADISSSKERKKTLAFTDPYFTLYNIFYIKKGSPAYDSLDALNGKTYITPKDYKNSNYIKKHYPLVKQLYVKSNLEAFQLLAAGKGDVVIDTKAVADYLLKENNITQVVSSNIIDDRYLIDELRISVEKNNHLLLSVLQKAQEKISQKEMAELKQKWFDEAEVAIVLTPEEKVYLANNTITYTGDPNWLPFEAFDKNGNYAGIIAEHVEILEKKLNKKFDKIITKNWLDTLALSEKKGVDIISGDAADMVLSKNYKAIDTYLKNPLVIVTRKEQPYIDDLKHLKDKKIAFIAGAGYSNDIFKKYPDIKFIECDTPQSGLLGVKTGKYDAFISTLSMSDYTIVQMGIEDIKIAGQTGIVMNLTLFVDKEKPLLHSIINKTMKTISKNKQYEIISKWRSSRVESVIDYTLVWQITIVFIVLSLTGLLFTLLLRSNYKKLKQSEQQNLYLRERMELAFDGSRDGLWDWNIIDDSVYYSPRWKEMLGYRDDELENSFDTWQSRMHPDDMEEVLKDVELSINNKDVLFENKHRLRHKDGHWVWIYDRGKVQRDMDGKAIRMIGTHTDLTTEINLNNELGELNETLEIRVQEQVKELDRRHTFMAQQARLASMGEMLSSIAHQWRQPLNRINSNVSVLRSVLRRDPVDHEMLAEQTEMIEKNTKYMSDTIGDFANFFHPEKKEVEFSLQNVIKKALELINQRTENVQIHIVSDKALEVYSFEKEYLQVVLIILNNAIDNFESKVIKEPKIDISIKEHAGMATLAICDNGGGIEEGDIDRIFDPYYSTKFAKEGTGLGLYVAKMLIENSMHGQLQVKNQQGSACFEIIIPQRKDKCLI